jgi:hypothetical protein
MRDFKAVLRTCVHRNTFTLWALLALALHALILVYDISYDQGGVGGSVVLSAPIWGFMYWLPSELLFALNEGSAIPSQRLVTVITGLTLCILMDWMVRRLRRRREPSA